MPVFRDHGDCVLFGRLETTKRPIIIHVWEETQEIVNHGSTKSFTENVIGVSNEARKC